MLIHLALSILIQTSPALACFAACPAGQDCYFEEVWLTEKELQKMADTECARSASGYLSLSTGLAVELQCSPNGNTAKQISQNLAMKARGEEGGKNFRTDCVGQVDCLAASGENRKILEERKEELTKR